MKTSKSTIKSNFAKKNYPKLSNEITPDAINLKKEINKLIEAFEKKHKTDVEIVSWNKTLNNEDGKHCLAVWVTEESPKRKVNFTLNV